MNAGRSAFGEAAGPAHLTWVDIPDGASFQEEALLLAKEVVALFNLKSDGLEASVRSLRWPGRFQEIPTAWNASMLVDAAHNPSGLARILPQLRARIEQHPNWTLVFGCTPQHDLQAFSQPLIDFCQTYPPKTIVLTKPLHGRYPGVPINALQQLDWPSESELHAREDAEASYRLLTKRRPAFTIVIGSLYLIGEMYETMGLWGSEYMELFPTKTQRDEA
jgi:folylpolyglutamate synthase/dihydropteroate synthase